MSTFGIFTLGCKVNQYESEAIAELLEANGFTRLRPEDICDIYIINTCTVTAESDRKCRQTIRRAIAKNPSAFVLVTGCLAETDVESISKIEGVDYICGNADKSKIAQAAIGLSSSKLKNKIPIVEISDINASGFERMCIKKFERTRAYVKIEDGCESRCTYCIIPNARGKIRSKPYNDVIDEVRMLTLGGCREIVLTGIETASYGRDIGSSLVELLEGVDRIEGIGRIRLGSLDPSIMKENFVKRIAKLKSLTHHFHISLQSGSDDVLRLMKRKYNSKMALESILMLKKEMPDVMLTTDVIVGFPGESEENFNETVDFAKKAEFLMMHVFPYSKRKGTPAATMGDQLDNASKKERVSRLMSVGKEIRTRLLDEIIKEGKTATVLFEDYKDGFAYGHTDNFIEVKVPSDRSLHSIFGKVEFLSHDKNVVTAKLLSTEEI